MNDMLANTGGGPLSATELVRFEEQGFLRIERLISDDAVSRLNKVYDQILSCETLAEGDRLLGGVTRQVMRPHQAHPLFADNEGRRNAERIASQIFGGSPSFLYDMLIYKPPQHPVETPWHQDFAYAYQPFTEAGTPSPGSVALQFWIALDDVDTETGCMHFVPGLQGQPLLPHRIASGDPEDEGRLLAIVDPERCLPLDKVVACPLAAGGATVHAYNTPHYTPPNASHTRRRRAYIFTYVFDAPKPG
jgi:hypothetical protein